MTFCNIIQNRIEFFPFGLKIESLSS
jgi:hypothetical protein